MAIDELKNQHENWTAGLNASINSSVTSIVITGASSNLVAPCVITVGTEYVLIDSVVIDSPSAGLDTLTVNASGRGHDGTTAASHTTSSRVTQWVYSFQFNELKTRVHSLEQMVRAIIGNSTDVVKMFGPNWDQLAVKAQGTPDMTVVYREGAGIVAGQPTGIITDETSSTFSAPSSNPRIDLIQMDRFGVISIKTGTEAGSPSVPSLDSSNMKLAEIYHRVGSAAIKDTDDASNSYITDSRVEGG